MALAREVSGVKKPVPSPRAHRTSRPAASTTVTVIGVPSALALSCAARTAVSATWSVISAIAILSFTCVGLALPRGPPAGPLR